MHIVQAESVGDYPPDFCKWGIDPSVPRFRRLAYGKNLTRVLHTAHLWTKLGTGVTATHLSHSGRQ